MLVEILTITTSIGKWRVYCRSLLWKFDVQSLCVWGGHGASHGKRVQSRQQPSCQQCESCSTVSKNELNLGNWTHCVVCDKENLAQPDVARRSQINKVRKSQTKHEESVTKDIEGKQLEEQQ